VDVSKSGIVPRDQVDFCASGWTWKHNFTAALDSVVERAFREKGATYSQIQLLENDLRAQPPPPAISWPEGDEQAAMLGAPGQSTCAVQRYMAMGSLITGRCPPPCIFTWADLGPL